MRLDFKFKLLLVLVPLLGVGAGIRAQNRVWSLDSCINYALGQNIQIRKSALTNDINRVNAEQARANRFPGVSASARESAGLTDKPNSTTGIYSYSGSANTSLSVSSSVPVYNGLKLQNAIRQADLDWRAGQKDVDAMRESVSLSVVDAYLQVLYAGEQVQNARAQVDVTDKQLSLAGERVALGSIAKSDYLQVKSQLANEKLTLANAENLLEMNKISLEQLMELPVSKDFDIEHPSILADPDRKWVPNPDSVYREALRFKPQIEAASIRSASSALDEKIAKADLYPQVSVDAGLSTGYYSLTDNLNLGQQLDHNFTPTVGLSVNIPIYQKNQVKSRMQIARINAQNTQLDEINTRNQLRKSIEQACEDVVSAQKDFEASQEQYDSEQESYAVASEKFDQGMINSVDFLFEKTNLISAESKLLQSKYNLIFSYKLLDFYLGKPLTF